MAAAEAFQAGTRQRKKHSVIHHQHESCAAAAVVGSSLYYPRLSFVRYVMHIITLISEQSRREQNAGYFLPIDDEETSADSGRVMLAALVPFLCDRNLMSIRINESKYCTRSDGA